MYLMYVDESGNCGLNDRESYLFILTGLIVHDSNWRVCLDKLVGFRKHLKSKYGLLQKEEIHASDFINNTPPNLLRIPRKKRWKILVEFTDLISSINYFSLVNILVDKRRKPLTFDVFEIAWKSLIQRFENTIGYGNFPGFKNEKEYGLILPDHTDDPKLEKLLRKMRRFNPVPHSLEWGEGYRDLPLAYVVEDPNFKDSRHSYFIQAADLCAYLLYQREAPNQYMKRGNKKKTYLKLKPVLFTSASRSDPLGIVRI